MASALERLAAERCEVSGRPLADEMEELRIEAGSMDCYFDERAEIILAHLDSLVFELIDKAARVIEEASELRTALRLRNGRAQR